MGTPPVNGNRTAAIERRQDGNVAEGAAGDAA
jgi:hypothetical protein